MRLVILLAVLCGWCNAMYFTIKEGDQRGRCFIEEGTTRHVHARHSLRHDLQSSQQLHQIETIVSFRLEKRNFPWVRSTHQSCAESLKAYRKKKKPRTRREQKKNTKLFFHQSHPKLATNIIWLRSTRENPRVSGYVHGISGGRVIPDLLG